jgi:hypothetical protein
MRISPCAVNGLHVKHSGVAVDPGLSSSIRTCAKTWQGPQEIHLSVRWERIEHLGNLFCHRAAVEIGLILVDSQE